MNVIATLRPLLAASRRGLTSALLIALVIAGVVSMHSMSGSPTTHLPPPELVVAHDVGQVSPSGPLLTPTDRAMPTRAAEAAGHAQHDGEGHCASGCGAHDSHDMTTAMCLMVLVVLLTLAAPPARFLHAVLGSLTLRIPPTEPHSRPAAAPSLHALGISRT